MAAKDIDIFLDMFSPRSVSVDIHLATGAVAPAGQFLYFHITSVLSDEVTSCSIMNLEHVAKSKTSRSSQTG